MRFAISHYSSQIQLLKVLRSSVEGLSLQRARKAVEEGGNDYAGALEWLNATQREYADGRLAKVEARDTPEGVIGLMVTEDRRKGVMMETRCETDFVTKSSPVIHFNDQILTAILSNKLAHHTLGNNQNTQYQHLRADLVSKVGENVKITRCHVFDHGSGGDGAGGDDDDGLRYGWHVHRPVRTPSGGYMGSIASFVECQVEGFDKDKADTVAAHATAFNPSSVPELMTQRMVTNETMRLSEFVGKMQILRMIRWNT